MQIKYIFLLMIYLTAFQGVISQTLNNDSVWIVGDVVISGNKTTKAHIIQRELTFNSGDTLFFGSLQNKIQKSKENLLNTSLFNYITIEPVRGENKKVDIQIMVEERWYIWPNVIFEHANRNFVSFLEDRDWKKINYGMYWIYNNFRGRKETLRLTTRLGYKELYSLFYDKPNLGVGQIHGLTVELYYFRKKEAELNLDNNKLVYFRYFDTYIWKQAGVKISYTYRPLYYTSHRIIAGFENFTISDTIARLNPGYLGDTRTTMFYPLLIYQFVDDHRDSKTYPLEGYYFDFFLRKEGLGIIKNEYRNVYLMPVFSWHGKISDRWFYSAGVKGKLSYRKAIPFNIRQALGYGDYMHGYEPYVINGSDFIFSRNYLKYCLMKQRVRELAFIKWKKFNKIHLSVYTNLLFDAAYVYDKNALTSNTFANRPLYSCGIGIDLVSYYDQVVRIEYAVNHTGQARFNIDIKAPILKSNN